TGAYAGIEPQAPNAEKGFGAGIRWKLTIDAGPHIGQTASRITSATPTPKNSCGKMLSGLIGRALKEGEQINLDEYVGKRYMIVIGAGQNGGTRIEVIVPITT